MKTKYVLVTIITALCIIGLFQLFYDGGEGYPEYHLSVGQIADFDLVAPFDFQILKSDEQLQEEYAEAISQADKPYTFSPDVEFEAYRNLDQLFDYIWQARENPNPESVIQKAKEQNFHLDNIYSLLYVNEDRINSLYNSIKNILSDLYKVGIYQGITTDSVLIVNSYDSEKYPRTRYFEVEEAKRFIKARLSSTALSLLENNLDKLVMPNLVIDAVQYARLQEEIKKQINPVSGMILQNEIIIRKNQRITEEDINKLNSLAQEYKARGERRSSLMQWLSFMGLLVYILACLFAFNVYYWHTPYRETYGNNGTYLLNLGFFLSSLMTAITCKMLNLNASLLPLLMFSISVAIIIGFDFAIIYSIFSILIIAPFANWDSFNLALLLTSILLILSLMRNFKSRHDFLRIGVYSFIILNILAFALGMVSYSGNELGEKFQYLLQNAGYSLISTVIAILGAMGLVRYFERKLHRATKQVLLELQDFNHPLLKRLATNAAGTYHHSLIVGNLAEQAAAAIGANPLLARVASYYHDIGKSVHPELFTENNEDSSEFYDNYTPEESADIIRDHVKEGVVLAQKYHLPQPVIDIINQHHGTSYIRFFLDAAQRKGEVTDLSAFRYPGPLPQTKEAALVMLADIVESTIKSKKEVTEEEIVKILDDTIQRLIREGQFNEAPITLKDLAKAKEVMLPILAGIYRKRIEYPEESSL
jgi:putative nucleotidyltransferase with HDIG domain